MREGGDGPVFGIPPGADFLAGFLDGLSRRFGHLDPFEQARIEIFVNTRRAQRRLMEILSTGRPGLVPRIRHLSDIGAEEMPGPPATRTGRLLHLLPLVEALARTDPGFRSKSGALELAEGLLDLLDECADEGVPLDRIARLDVSTQSLHWQRSRDFLGILAGLEGAAGLAGGQAEMRRAISRQIADWSASPPAHPVMMVGSTGSRGSTFELLMAVAGLPQGHVVLPAFDFDLPGTAWPDAGRPEAFETHPQFRYAKILRQLGLMPGDVGLWDGNAPAPERNRLVSLALRPAPYTAQWIAEQPSAQEIGAASGLLTLCEASDRRQEATAIALRLRVAAQTGQNAAVITPDRVLTRQIAATLDRWELEADDSAGTPLPQSAPGRFLRQTGELMRGPLGKAALLSLLKHPLTASGGGQRGEHLRHAHDLELWLRARSDGRELNVILGDWAARDERRQDWAAWLSGLLGTHPETAPLAGFAAAHVRLAQAFAAGPGAGAGEVLWAGDAGAGAAKVMDDLASAAPESGDLMAETYLGLFDRAIRSAEVRSAIRPHPDIRFLGTLEARAETADLVILAGLNEGVWPGAPPPDPWLNRAMRAEAGLLLPERGIGLAAHDFQQAIGAREVWLTRSLRDASAMTVPSRWLNRLTNLLHGAEPDALEAMKGRGQEWTQRARALDRPAVALDPEPRPAPAPPTNRRPTRFSVTEIERLIRDPYAIYARRILGLRALKPADRPPDAALRGEVFHDAVARVLHPGSDAIITPEAMADAMAAVLKEQIGNPAVRLVWANQFRRAMPSFLADEAVRGADGDILRVETKGEMLLAGTAPPIAIHGRADRLDRLQDGRLAIYDYKTGKPPSERRIRHFDRQLLIEALIAEAGGFEGVDAEAVAKVGHLGLGSSPEARIYEMDEGTFDLAQTREELIELIRTYLDPAQGYAARRAMESVRYDGDFDHLARYGEWDETVLPTVIGLGS